MSNTENQQLTPQQIAEYKKATLEFYKERIAVLKYQKEYEILCADIEEAKLRALIAQVKYAQIVTPPSDEDEENEVKNTKTEE